MLAKDVKLLRAVSYYLLFLLLLNLLASSAFAYVGSPEVISRRREIDARRRELHERVNQARKKEEQAKRILERTNRILQSTTCILNHKKTEWVKTKKKINETEHKIVKTQSAEAELSEQAQYRLREIYEGHRLSLLEMFFQVTSLQSFIDLFYYQERVAESDKRLLDELKTKAQLLAIKKNNLGVQKNVLGEVISQVTKEAQRIFQQKTTQEEVAERLTKQREFWEQAEERLALESRQFERQIMNYESSHRGPGETVVGSGRMMWPLHAPIMSYFGYRNHPIFHRRKFHQGIDISGPNRAAVKAADSGTVIMAGRYGGYGNVVIISHGDKLSTLYGHLSSVAVTSGQNVKKGEVIGFEGSTGYSTGPHLHFEVRVNGRPVDPLAYLPKI